MKKLTTPKGFKNFILEGFSYLLIEFIDMMLPEWLWYIMNHWLNGSTMTDYLAEQMPGIEYEADLRHSIKTNAVVKSRVAFDFHLN